MNKPRVIATCVLILGIILLIIGSSIDNGYETRSYHQVYKDFTGYYSGRDVTYLSPKGNGAETWGFLLSIAGGIGMAATKK